MTQTYELQIGVADHRDVRPIDWEESVGCGDAATDIEGALRRAAILLHEAIGRVRDGGDDAPAKLRDLIIVRVLDADGDEVESLARRPVADDETLYAVVARDADGATTEHDEEYHDVAHDAVYARREVAVEEAIDAAAEWDHVWPEAPLTYAVVEVPGWDVPDWAARVIA